MEGLLAAAGVTSAYHYAPLHYLLFIARSKRLLSKPELQRLGYNVSHFRSTSRRQDEKRGFSSYVHLTLNQCPPILQAKLQAGFPHFEIRIPAVELDQIGFHLCRFNIAKSRYLRGGKKPPSESAENGRYYGDKRLPTAESESECRALLAHNLGRVMIEVLVPVKLPLSENSTFIFFDPDDAAIATDSLSRVGLNWNIEIASNSPYARRQNHVARVQEFLRRAEEDENWRGNGLEFDSF